MHSVCAFVIWRALSQVKKTIRGVSSQVGAFRSDFAYRRLLKMSLREEMGVGPEGTDLRGTLSARDDTVDARSVFANRWLQGFQRLSNRAFAMTLTELRAMAAPAIMGLR